MIAAGVSFLLLLWAAERGIVSTRTVLKLAVAYHLGDPAASAPAVEGRLQLRLLRTHLRSRYGGNPYVNTPADYPANDLWRFDVARVA